MSNMQRDVHILGAGPAGLQVARFLLKGYSGDVYVYEEHEKIGRPIHCTGLVSLEGLKKDIGIIDGNLITNTFRGAIFFSPSGKRLIVGRPETVAVVVDRERLEERLYEEVLSLGAHVKLGSYVNLADFSKLVRSKNSFGIVAGGAKYLDEEREKYLLPALQYDIKVKDNIGIAHHVLIFMGEKFSNGLFAWAIPLGDETYKVGVATKGKTLVRMKYVLKTLERIGITPLHVIKTYGGTVYTGGLVKHLLRGDLLYIGDSAGQTKPTTGGGLVYLSIAARLLASALIRNDPTLYEKNVRATLGHETSLQFALRKVLNNLSDPELDEIFRTVKEMHGEELISRIGSMDRQAFLIREIGFKYLFERPSLVFKLLSKVFLD